MMSELLLPSDKPIFVMEGRYGLPGQPLTETRTNVMPRKLAEEGITTLLIDPKDPETFDKKGIRRGGVICRDEIVYNELPESIVPDAWRLRDPVWEKGDPPAFVAQYGYNSAQARRELATNLGMLAALEAAGLADAIIPSVVVQDRQPLDNLPESPGGVLVKPSGKRSDVSEDPTLRAALVDERHALNVAINHFGGNAIVQPRLTTWAVDPLAGMFNLTLSQKGEYPPGSLHAIRVGGLLAREALDPSFVEFRATRATPTENDIGKRFATEVRIFSPGNLFRRLPELAELHRRVHGALRNRFGELNNLAVDYIVGAGGEREIWVANVLARALTPNLKQVDSRRIKLAKRTIDHEVDLIKRLVEQKF